MVVDFVFKPGARHSSNKFGFALLKRFVPGVPFVPDCFRNLAIGSKTPKPDKDFQSSGRLILAVIFPCFCAKENRQSWKKIQNPRKTLLICLRIASFAFDVHLVTSGREMRLKRVFLISFKQSLKTRLLQQSSEGQNHKITKVTIKKKRKEYIYYNIILYVY